jgi:hypothetical protein
MALPYQVAGKIITSGADALDYKLPSWVRKALDPVGAAKEYLTSKADEAMDLPSGSVGAAIDPAGFAKNIAKDIGKDYVKSAFIEKEPIPVEDRIPSPSFNFSNNTSSQFDSYDDDSDYKRGGKVKAKTKSSSKPKTSTASRRGDGIAQRGKTRGRMV